MFVPFTPRWVSQAGCGGALAILQQHPPCWGGTCGLQELVPFLLLPTRPGRHPWEWCTKLWVKRQRLCWSSKIPLQETLTLRRTGTEEPFSSPHPIPSQAGAQLCTGEGSGTRARVPGSLDELIPLGRLLSRCTRETLPGSWRGGHFGSCEMPPMWMGIPFLP